MKVLFFLFLMMTATGLYGQVLVTDYTVKIDADSRSGSQFSIRVNKTGDTLKVVYAILDSVGYHALKHNQQYMGLNQKLLANVKSAKINRDSLPVILNQMDSLTKAYSHYSKDSISINAETNNWYVKLIEKLYSSPDEQLESKMPYNPKTASEGTKFTIVISTNGLSRTIYTVSPTTASNPLLSDFIHQTTFLYRKTKQTGFLDKRTNGY